MLTLKIFGHESKYPDTRRVYSSIRVKMLTLKVSRNLASVQLDTSQNAHPQSILKLGVCTARYKSKCSTSKYPDTWRLWSWIRVKMLTLKVFRHESKYPDTRRLWSSIRVKMLTLKVSRHLASVQLDTSQNAHPQSILKLGVCTARYKSKCSTSKYPDTWRLWSWIRVKNAHPQSILKLGVCGARYE